MYFCNTHQREAPLKKKFNWLAAFLWFLLGGYGVIVYLVYFMVKKPDTCSLCSKEPAKHTSQGTQPAANPSHKFENTGPYHQPNRAPDAAPTQPSWTHILDRPPSPTIRAEPPPPTGVAPTRPSRDWRNEADLERAVCPSCNLDFHVQPVRPLQVSCMLCGSSGTLPAIGESAAP